ncbi:MAG: hypothetical protein HYZ22_14310 [Chloroflexi bacterium]|nr:hypothetical protein [Chloroflexota bacterium]
MKPKLFLTIAGAYFLLDGLAGFFMVSGFDFITYAYSIFCMSLGALFLMTRNEETSKARNAIFMTGFLSSFAVSLIAFYAQWSGLFMVSPAGYIPPTLWLIVALGFLFVGRANMAQ